MNPKDFFKKWNGKGIDFDGYYGFQCMDLAHRYAVDVNNQDIPAAPSAKDVWSKNTPGYNKIVNTPDGVPELGDIVIWGTGVGADGHIAVFSEGDSSAFTSYDQNWPINSLCHFQKHNYNGVLGWLHPQVVESEQMPPYLKQFFQEHQIDYNNEFQTRAFLQLALDYPGVKSDLDSNKAEVQRLTASNQLKADKIDDLNTVNNTLQNQIISLREDLAECQAGAPNTPPLPPTPSTGFIAWLKRFLGIV